jgi:hypothetical protein
MKPIKLSLFLLAVPSIVSADFFDFGDQQSKHQPQHINH